jgi:hypothetical protein
VFAAPLGDLPSVDLSGQLDVGDEYVRGSPPVPFQRLFPVGRVDHVMPFFAQRLDNEFADERIVLNEEYSHSQLLNTLESGKNL